MFTNNVDVVLEFVNPIVGTTNHFKSVPGSIIQGEAVITVRKKTVSCECVDFMLTGNINIKLSETMYAVVVSVTRKIRLSQQIVDPIKLYRINGPIVLEPGVYRYPFKLDISSLSMPSYPADWKCRIDYQIETVLHARKVKRFTSPIIIQKLNPIHPLEMEATEEFKKLASLQLLGLTMKAIPILFLATKKHQRALMATDQRTGCFTSSNISLEVTLPKSAFEPGEKFRIRLVTSNNSRKVLTPEVKLKYDRSCQLKEMKSYKSCTTMARTNPEKAHKIPAKEGSREMYINFTIPARCHPVTIDYLGSTLKVNFFISVKLSASWGCNDARVTIPVRIGYNHVKVE